jgi:hypothetical protein
MPRNRVLIPADIREAAIADSDSEMARHLAARERFEKQQHCTDAVNAFKNATAILWSSQPDKASSFIAAVHRTLLNVCKALEEADCLDAWEQIDHAKAYEDFRVRNHRIMSKSSYEWARKLFGNACEGDLLRATVMETWNTKPLKDAIHWLRIFIVGLSGEGAVLPMVQDPVPIPRPAPLELAAVQHVQPPDLANVFAAQPLVSTPPERLSFDSNTWTITLDGQDFRISQPKTFQIYRVIAKAAGNITNSEIQKKVMGVKGKKTIPKHLKVLPRALMATIKTNTTGHWLKLPSQKKKGTTRT